MGNFDKSLEHKPEPTNILWIDDCDPRSDPDFCHDSKDLKIFDQFYGTITGLGGTLSYSIPTSEDSFAAYDVVVANFCSAAIHEHEIALLVNYVTSGGSVIALGDNFCTGVGPVNGEWLNSAQAASIFTRNWGVSITSDDDLSLIWANPVLMHPLTQNMKSIYAFRHAYLVVQSPSKILFRMGDKPFISIYEQTGTVITIPNTGFHWGSDFRSEIADSDNFAFWRNMLNWLATQTRNKLK